MFNILVYSMLTFANYQLNQTTAEADGNGISFAGLSILSKYCVSIGQIGFWQMVMVAIDERSRDYQSH